MPHPFNLNSATSRSHNLSSNTHRSMATFTIRCWIWGRSPFKNFQIEIEPTKDISALRDAIKEKEAHRLAEIDASDLELFMFRKPIAEAKLFEAFVRETQKPEDWGDLVVGSWKKVSTIFTEPPEDSLIHIIVVPPTGTFAIAHIPDPLLTLANPTHTQCCY